MNQSNTAADELDRENDEYEYDEQPTVHRSQGRTPPPEIEPSFEIKLDGQLIGTVYPKRLKGGAQIDLEDARTTRQVINWVVNYAGGNAKQVESIIRELDLPEVTTFIRNVALAFEKSLQLGKRRGPRS